MSPTDERPPTPEALPHPVVDSHCHLDMDDSGEQWGIRDVIEAARSVGVPRIVQIGCDLPGARWAAQAALDHPELVAAVALHPNEAPRLHESGDLEDALAEIERLLTSTERVRAVGETGLDYFRTGEQGRAAQHESFRAHIEMAKRNDKTLVIHDRDSHADVIKVLDECGVPDRTVMHCFSGDADFAQACLDRGCWLSFSGIITFKNAQSIRDALAIAPLDRVLVETDAPFLAPTPHRGQPNASYLLPFTVRAMAQVLDREVEALCEAIDANTDAAFGGHW